MSASSGVNKDFGIPLGFWRSGGSLAERLHRGELHRRAGARRRRRIPYEIPARAARQVAPPSRRCWSWPRRGGTGARRPPAAQRAASPVRVLLRELCRPRGGGLGVAGRRSRPSTRIVVRHRLRVRGESRPGQAPRWRAAPSTRLTAALLRRRSRSTGVACSSPTSTTTRCRESHESPVIEAHILDSGEAAGGLGEPGVPTVAPAVCTRDLRAHRQARPAVAHPHGRAEARLGGNDSCERSS